MKTFYQRLRRVFVANSNFNRVKIFYKFHEKFHVFERHRHDNASLS